AEYEEATIDIYTYNINGFDSMIDGTQNVTVEYKGKTETLGVTVKTGLKTDERGVINGYQSLGEKEVVIPTEINGTAVTGFAENALVEANIEKLYIYDDNISYPDGDVFNAGTTVYCYEDSTTDIYLKARGIFPEYIGAASKSFADFSEEFYAKYNGGKMLTMTSSQQSLDAGDFSYATAAFESNRWLNVSNFGFYIENVNEDPALKIDPAVNVLGENTVTVSINGAENKDALKEAVLSFDFKFPAAAKNAYITVNDGSDNVDSVSASEVSADTWYKYEIKYSDSSYSRTIYDADGGIAVPEEIVSEGGGDKAVYLLGMNNAWVWGDSVDVYFYIDNLSYSQTPGFDTFVTVTDENGMPVEGAKVEMNDGTGYTDENGETTLKAAVGKYTAKISKEGYESALIDISVKREGAKAEVAITRTGIKAVGIESDRNEIVIRSGSYDVINAKPVPYNAYEAVEFASASDEIAKIDENGLITAGKTGETKIVMTAGDASAECVVKVIDADYEQKAAAAEIAGADSTTVNVLGKIYMQSYRVYIYDEKGARIFANDTEWSAEGADIEPYGEIVTITPHKDAEKVVLKARFGDVSAEKNIDIYHPNGSEILLDADFSRSEYTAANRVQGKETQEVAVGDMIFTVGARSAGGDGVTGFDFSSGKYMTARAGRYDNAGRNAYITIKNPHKLSGGSYIFVADVYFEKGGEKGERDININIGDGQSVLTSVNASDKGLEKEKWYTYMLMCKGGVFTECIYDENGTEVLNNTLDGRISAISKIEFIGSSVNTANTAVRIKGMELKKLGAVMYTAAVNVEDENGIGIPEVKVSVKGAGKDAVTNKNGIAYLDVFAGTNIFIAEGENISGAVIADISADHQNVWIKNQNPTAGKIISETDGEALVFTCGSNFDMYAVKYDAAYDEGGALEDIHGEETILPYGSSITAAKKAHENSRIMIWDGMIPVI
ncbi:MAG: carboxypeptidase regulatory-like domain-containing protein, partial [Oscillospiraceae bacterium]|nr:carboxypeptidase regulatory-like domain-containing protein [Oscillospiraceae bacterium]